MHDFLHSHPGAERRAGLDARHVIVDQPDWRLARGYIDKLPLTADKVTLWPSMLAFSLGKEGEIYPVWIDMVGTAGFVQVRHADLPTGGWEERATNLYGRLHNATAKAREILAAQQIQEIREASRAVRENREAARKVEVIRKRVAQEMQEVQEMQEARDNERGTREARKAERVVREASREAREAVAAHRVAIIEMAARQAKRAPRIWPIDLAEAIWADVEAEAVQPDEEAREAGLAAQAYVRKVGGGGLCQPRWAGERVPWD